MTAIIEIDARRDARTAANRARLRALILKPTRTNAELDEADDLAVKLGFDLKAALEAVAEAKSLRGEAERVPALDEAAGRAEAAYFAVLTGETNPEIASLEAELEAAKQAHAQKLHSLSWARRCADSDLAAAEQAAAKLAELTRKWPDVLA
jgi:hypothetical protein